MRHCRPNHIEGHHTRLLAVRSIIPRVDLATIASISKSKDGGERRRKEEEKMWER
jgi:hypothetical protein